MNLSTLKKITLLGLVFFVCSIFIFQAAITPVAAGTQIPDAEQFIADLKEAAQNMRGATQEEKQNFIDNNLKEYEYITRIKDPIAQELMFQSLKEIVNNANNDTTSGTSPLDTNTSTTDNTTPTSDTNSSITDGNTTQSSSLAYDGLVPCGNETDPQQAAQSCNFSKFIELISKVMNFAIIMAIPISTITFAAIGLMLLTAQGNVEKIRRAKAIAWNLMWGFLFILSAWIIIHAIASSLLKPEFNFFMQNVTP